MPDGLDDPRLNATQELARAQRAMDEGDLRHAAEHIATALAFAPTMPEVHEALARLAARADDVLDLFPLNDHVFIGVAVARAHLLAAAGRHTEGLEILAAASGHAPDVEWAGVPWVTAPDLPYRVSPDDLARIFMQLCSALPTSVPEEQRSPLAPYLTLARHAVEAHPGHGLLLGAASDIARRLGETALAVSWAARATRQQPAKITEVWLGYAHLDAGQPRDAIAALRRAIDHDPDDLTLYADIANALADDGRITEALEWTDRALARNPTFTCAVHTAHRLRYLRDGELRHLVALADFQRDHPDVAHEHRDLEECCETRPWLGFVLPADGPIATLIRRALITGRPPGTVRLRTPDTPSATRALLSAFPHATITMSPHAALESHTPHEGRQLWRVVGSLVEPALPPPSEATVERIRQLAYPRWPHPPAAYDMAVSLATASLDDLLGLLVHPPSPPRTEVGQTLASHDPTLWVRCVQVWSCLGMLHHRTDEPWPESTRRRTLLELVWGIDDWIAEAALFAMITAAWIDPSVREEVAALVVQRLNAAAQGRRRPTAFAWSLAYLALATPDLPPTATTTARRLIASYEAAKWWAGLLRWFSRPWRR